MQINTYNFFSFHMKFKYFLEICIYYNNKHKVIINNKQNIYIYINIINNTCFKYLSIFSSSKKKIKMFALILKKLFHFKQCANSLIVLSY